MSIDYKTWNSLEEGTVQFHYVIEKNPRTSELYGRAKELIEASEFKGKLKLSMIIFNYKVWFTVWPPYQTPDVYAQYEQDSFPLHELSRIIELHLTDIITQKIGIRRTLPYWDVDA